MNDVGKRQWLRIRELEETIQSCYRQSAMYGSTHDEHLKRIKRDVWESLKYKRLPQWAHSYLQGVDHTMFNMLYACGIDQSVEFKRIPPLIHIQIGRDGRLFDNDDWLQESSEYKLSMECVHVWFAHWQAGRLKIWSC